MPSALRLGPKASFALLVSILLTFLASSTAPTPLYAVYAREWGFSPITTTVIFGSYALAVLVSLQIFGRLSDHVGRKPLLIAALLLQILGMVFFTTAGSVESLITARVIQGVGTGVAVGAMGAGLLDLNRTRGAFANSFGPVLGTAMGPLIAGLVVQYLSWPTHLIYVALLCVFAIQTIGMFFLPETVTPKPGGLAGLKPEFKLPQVARVPYAVAAPVIFAVWALVGFYAALAPGLINTLIHSTNAVYGGLGLSTLAGAGTIAALLLRPLPARAVMLISVPALVVGVAVTLLSVGSGGGGTGAVTGFFIGTAIAGIGLGGGFQVGIRLVVPLVEAHERGGVMSLLYAATYLGMGVPTVIGGVLVVHGGGLIDTAREYGIAVIVLALLALTGMLLSGDRLRQSSAPGILVASSAGPQGLDAAEEGPSSDGSVAVGTVPGQRNRKVD